MNAAWQHRSPIQHKEHHQHGGVPEMHHRLITADQRSCNGSNVGCEPNQPFQGVLICRKVSSSPPRDPACCRYCTNDMHQAQQHRKVEAIDQEMSSGDHSDQRGDNSYQGILQHLRCSFSCRPIRVDNAGDILNKRASNWHCRGCSDTSSRPNIWKHRFDKQLSTDDSEVSLHLLPASTKREATWERWLVAEYCAPPVVCSRALRISQREPMLAWDEQALKILLPAQNGSRCQARIMGANTAR